MRVLDECHNFAMLLDVGGKSGPAGIGSAILVPVDEVKVVEFVDGLFPPSHDLESAMAKEPIPPPELRGLKNPGRDMSPKLLPAIKLPSLPKP